MRQRLSKPPGPRKPSNRRGAEAEARLTRIVSEAKAQFLAKGYSGASLDDIIAGSGGSKATIQKYFGGKAGLFASVVAEQARQWVESTQLAVAQGTPAQVLRAFGESVLHFYLRPDALHVYRGVIAEGHPHPGVAQAFYERGHAQIVAALAACLKTWHDKGLVHSHDVSADADRFLHLVRAGLYEQTLLGLRKSHTRAELIAQVDGSVRLFLSGLAR